MAGLVDEMLQTASGADELARLSNNPIFTDLKSALAKECVQAHVPYTLSLMTDATEITGDVQLTYN